MRTSLSAKPLPFHAPALKRAEKSLHHIRALDPQGYLAILVVAQSDDPGVSDGAGAGVWSSPPSESSIHFCCVPSDIREPTLVRRHNVVGTDNAHLLEVVNENPAIWPFGFCP